MAKVRAYQSRDAGSIRIMGEFFCQGDEKIKRRGKTETFCQMGKWLSSLNGNRETRVRFL